MLLCFGCSMTSIGINCEQNGSTLSSASTCLYCATISGNEFSPLRHDLILNTGVLFSEAIAANYKKKEKISK